MGAETAHKSEEAVIGHTADQHLSQRRQELDKRLGKWAKWFVGGLGVQVAGLVLSFAVPWVGVPLYITGAVAEGVGTVGIVGNRLKFFRKKKN